MDGFDAEMDSGSVISTHSKKSYASHPRRRSLTALFPEIKRSEAVPVLESGRGSGRLCPLARNELFFKWTTWLSKSMFGLKSWNQSCPRITSKFASSSMSTSLLLRCLSQREATFFFVSIVVSEHAVPTDNFSEAITGVLVIVIHDWLTKLCEAPVSGKIRAGWPPTNASVHRSWWRWIRTSGNGTYSRYGFIPFPGLTAGRTDRRLVQPCRVSGRVGEEERLSSGDKPRIRAFLTWSKR